MNYSIISNLHAGFVIYNEPTPENALAVYKAMYPKATHAVAVEDNKKHVCSHCGTVIDANGRCGGSDND